MARPAPTANVPSGTMRRARSTADARLAASAVASLDEAPGDDPCEPEGTWGVDTVSSRALPSGHHSRRSRLARSCHHHPMTRQWASIRLASAHLVRRRGAQVDKGRGNNSGAQQVRRQHRSRGRLVVAGVMLAALAVSACGSGTSSKATPDTKPGVTTPTDTSLGEGVTADSIKLGIALVNFDCIKQYTDSIRLGQPAVYKAFIKDMNDKGGIAGRKIVPDIKEYCPLTNQQILTYCTAFTQDDHVFAVLGTFIDFSGDAQTCIAKQQKRLLVTFDLTQAIMDKSPPAYIVTPGTIPERSVSILLALAKKEKTLEGKTVAVLGDTNVSSVVKNSIEPGLKDLGVKTGSTALLSINNGGDTTQAQTQLDSFIERWKTEGVNAIFMSGNYASAKQFVEKLRQKMPGV